MKKYFITSDIHGFYDELSKALKQASFDINNPEHILIVCGDLFDRGKKPVELYHFIKSLPKERRILIRGNHEYLLLDLIGRNGFFHTYDLSNGTFSTWNEFNTAGLLDEIKEWILSDEWVNYYEVGKYIFVHSFIPLTKIEKFSQFYYEYNPNWRENATQQEFIDSTWGCPFNYYDQGLFTEESKKGKILVCGHWHTSDFYNHYTRDKKQMGITNNPIYLSENLIALDACTAASKGVNILVIDNDSLVPYNYNMKRGHKK